MKKWLVRYIDYNDNSSEGIIIADSEKEARLLISKKEYCYRVVEVREFQKEDTKWKKYIVLNGQEAE